jgi:hypothetical protein
MTTPLAREGRKINTGKQLYNLHAMSEVRPNYLEWETRSTQALGMTTIPLSSCKSRL